MSIPQSVLANERRFFDDDAAALSDSDLVMPPNDIARYTHARMAPLNIPKETAFALMGPLKGKRALDYCCGTGDNACLLALCGADVTAFDLSPGAVEKARRRAELLGVADRIQFDVREAGETGYAPASFDVILGFAALHHLLFDLPMAVAEIATLLKPDGVGYFVEPMANSSVLQRIRRMVPVIAYKSDDERQLKYEDLDALRTHVPTLELYHAFLFERLHRIIGNRFRRPLRRIDYYVMRWLPFLRRYAGDVLIVAKRK
jgi:SAM-dependent methyltransferase